ncbi:MAG: Zn-ribbon domain-containing OB-fold protein [Dehalococcoidia bacterium]
MTTQPAGEYTRPLPDLDRKLTQPYWEGTRQHELRIQQCDACGHRWFPPSFCCPQCLNESYTWTKVSGRAKLWSWINMWQMYYLGFANERPYLVAFVELEEGPRLMAGLEGVAPDSADLRCDIPLEVVFDDVTPEVTLPRFRPVQGAE